MSTPSESGFQAACRRLLESWARLWGRPGLEDSVTVEASVRQHRALGRAFPGRRLIRLAAAVAAGPEPALAEVLCHEAAHIVAHDLHGRAVRPHGREWRALVQVAGFTPRLRIDVRELGITLPPPPAWRERVHRVRYVYEHRCAVCQAARTCGRVVRAWRCAACLEAGRSGELEVRRWAAARARSPAHAARRT